MVTDWCALREKRKPKQLFLLTTELFCYKNSNFQSLKTDFCRHPVGKCKSVAPDIMSQNFHVRTVAVYKCFGKENSGSYYGIQYRVFSFITILLVRCIITYLSIYRSCSG